MDTGQWIKLICSGTFQVIDDYNIDDYAEDGGPEVVWHLRNFYQDP